MKLEYFTKVKLVAASVVLMTSSSLLYNNCSGKGFNIAGSGEANLASSEPSVTAVTFRSAPLENVNANSVDFSYDISGANTSGVSAKCYLDQTLQADCSSPMDLSSVPDGDYTLTVVAANQNSLVLAQAKRSFRLDRKAPMLVINSAPSGTINTTSASIAFSVTDNFPGAVVYCSLDNAVFAACTSPYNMSNLAQGAHNVKIYAQDRASNKSATQTISFSVDTAIAIPSVAISQMPSAFSNSASASFSFSGASTGSTIASYQCSMDNSAFAACSSPQAYSSLAEGNHSFSVKAIDASGQSSAAANYNFAVDLTKPSTPVVSSNQMNPTKSTSLNLTFNSTDSSGVAKYECKLDAGSFATCVSPQAFSGLSSASHSFAVRATDKAGNVSAEGSYSIVVDTVAPVVTISSQPASSTQSTSASFAFSVSDALSGVNLVECQLDSQAYASCVSPQAYNSLAAGNHTFNLRGTDKAGNSSVQSYSWSIASASTPTPTPTPVGTPDPSDACPLLTAEQQKYPGATVKSAMTYGLKGDGTTDEYDAFQKIAADVSGKAFTSRMIVYFPKGTYYLNRTLSTVGANSNRPITYKNASNFSLIGCTGAVVSVKGDFDMPNDNCSASGCYSTVYQMTSFRFENSSNFKLSGFEINGNVNLMTRAKPAGVDLAETFSHGVVTAAATNYEISNVKSHHFAGDGFYVGDNMGALDDGGVYDNVEAYNNARQGMSVIQSKNMLVKNSTFKNIGFTDGSYPNHAPGAGVDVEPNWGPADGVERTQNLTFDNCKFLYNKGIQWVGGDNGAIIQNVTLKNSTIESRPDNTSSVYTIIMSLPGGVIENNIINTHDGAVIPTYNEGYGDIKLVNTIVRGNTITSSGVGLQVLDTGATTVIENNTFISAHTPSSDGPFPNVVSGASSFSGNTISYPAKNFGSKSVVGVIKAPTFINNKITTDSTSANYTIRIGPGQSATGNTIGPHILLSQ